MATVTKCLYSYSRVSRENTEIIENIIEQISSEEIQTRSIYSTGPSGSTQLDNATSAIDDSDLIIFDLTNLDTRVLFEMGYAISGDKKILISLNSSYPHSRKNYQRLAPFPSIPYIEYTNSYDFVGKFYSEEPQKSIRSTIFGEIIQSIINSQSKSPAIFYLQCPERTEASIRLTTKLKESNHQLVIDDPSEVSSQPLIWYAQNAYHSYGLIAHLIDYDRTNERRLIQNAKYILTAGMSFGFGKPLIILSHTPAQYDAVFNSILTRHETAQECLQAVDNWLPTIEESLHQQKEEYEKRQKERKNIVGLKKINLGEYIAENEQLDLLDYFVPTAPYQEALNTSYYKLFVGRKGSGKTANLYALENELRSDKRNHVCVITPVDYEFEGVLRLLVSNLSKAESGYLTESLWKYLIYTELSRGVYENIQEKPEYLSLSDEEENIVKYIDDSSDLRKSFTERLEYAIEELCKIDPNENIRTRRARVSEILHKKLLVHLHDHLSNFLVGKNKVYVLVDNLDKAWNKREDIDILADFIFGLLSASQEITNQFRRGGLNREKVNLVLIVFLRSDIFSYIMTSAREGDKLSSAMMDWNDPILLGRIIEENFCNSLGEELAPGEIWEKFFVPETRGIPSQEYITKIIIPRPRDIIFLCKNALSFAINHKHSQIEEIDIISAEKVYSEYIFKSLLAETETKFGEVEIVLYEFVGKSEVVTKEQLVSILKECSIPSEETDKLIDILFENTFLGLETCHNTFEYLYESNRKKVLKKLAENHRKISGQERYKINYPFHAYLEITSHEDIYSVPVGNEHPNIAILLERMENALEQEDYSAVLHSCSNIFETMAKDIVKEDTIQDQTLASFFERYRKDSVLSDEILDYILVIYKSRSTTPLAAHGSIEEPTINKNDAITLAEITRAFVRIEYKLKNSR